MSSFKILAATALMAAVPSVLAGSAIINNNCDFPVYITHSENGADQAQKEYQAGASYKENIQGSAVCLKVMTQRGFCLTDNCVQLEYTSASDFLWYDLSNINAQGLGKLIEYGMSVNVTDPSALQINCPAGNNNFLQCTNTYYQPYDDKASLSAKPDSDLVMNLCSGEKSSKPLASLGGAVSSVGSHIASAVAPSVAAPVSSAASAATTHAPVTPAVDNQAGHGPEVVVTVTKTMMAREEETAAPEKRHIHAHAHHHRH